MPPRAGNVAMNMGKALSLLPPGTLGPWPFQPGLVPEDREWHRRRGSPGAEGSIPESLYGKGWPGAQDHPSHRIPR
jgi:hypothetical protein